MYDLQSKTLLKVFSSITEAAKYLQQNKQTTAKAINGIITHIANVCNKKRKSAYKYYWEYI